MVFPLNLISCCTMAISSRGHFRTNVWGPSHFSPSPYFAWGRTIGGESQTPVSRFSSEKFLTRLLWGENCFDSFRNFWLAFHCIWFNPLSKAFLFFSQLQVSILGPIFPPRSLSSDNNMRGRSPSPHPLPSHVLPQKGMSHLACSQRAASFFSSQKSWTATNGFGCFKLPVW